MKSSNVGMGLLAVTVVGLFSAGIAFGFRDQPAEPQPPGPVTTAVPTRHCLTEDGVRPGQGYPCTWDCLTDGNGKCGPGKVRYLVYGDPSECPVARADVRCPGE
jgi:hypothetical protein